MKKSTHWITLPEEGLHTPAGATGKSAKKITKEEMTKTQKIVWGVTFVVMILIALVVLAPEQFSQMFKGSLFDTVGVEETELKVNLLPPKPADAGTLEEENKNADGQTAPDGGAGGSQEGSPLPVPSVIEGIKEGGGAEAPKTVSENTVEPEKEAVSISVAPLAKDCQADIACFLANFETCSLAKASWSFQLFGQDFESALELTGSKEDKCAVDMLFSKSPESGLLGKKISCSLLKAKYDVEGLKKELTDDTKITAQCTGEGAGLLAQYLKAQTEKAAAAASDQQKLIDELSKQLDSLQKQRTDDIKTMQDLSNVLNTPSNVYPSAAEGAGVPPGVATTAAIGQPSPLEPGFRGNPYRVTVAPEEVLRQNLARGGQYAAQPAGYSATGYSPYSAPQLSLTSDVAPYATAPSSQVLTNGKTPDSGPSEILLLAFALTFLGLAGWKLVKIMTS